MPVLSDRKLSITAQPVLIWSTPDSVTVQSITYTQTSSDPPMPNRVDKKTGNIDLSNMPNTGKNTDNVDIAITLDTSKLLDFYGLPQPAQWGNVGDPQISWGNWDGVPPKTAWAWFCANPPLGQKYDTKTPVLEPGMASIRTSDLVVTIDDNTFVNTGSYIFCLGLVLLRPGGQRYFITIDPVIGDKGISKPPVD